MPDDEFELQDDPRGLTNAHPVGAQPDGAEPAPAQRDSGEAEPEKAPGQLNEDLSESDVNMMAFSQCIGIGLLLQAGRIVYLAGPALATLAYVLAGTILWASAVSLGEMSALFPVKGPIIVFPVRYLDRSLGFTAGWMTWFSWVFVVILELVAIAHIFQFHYPEDLLQQAGYPEPTLQFDPQVSPAVFVFSFWLIMVSVNLLPVRHLADLEVIFGSIKMLYLSLICAFNVALHAMRPPDKEAFWTWNSPYSGASQNYTLHNGSVVSGDGGRFLGMWDAITHGLFGLVGFETIAIAAAENADRARQETVKLATRKISLRIILLYALCTFTAGLNVPYTYPLLSSKEALSISHGQSSIFVIAPVLGRLTGWPLFFNYFMVFTATSAGTMAIYNASRTLHALALIEDVWPASATRFRQWLATTTRSGVPKHAVLVCGVFGSLGFVAVNPNSNETLARISRACVIGMLITYGIVSASYIQFYGKLQRAATGQDETVLIPAADGRVDLSIYQRGHPGYPFKSRWQPYTAYYATISCVLIVFFNGWGTLVPPVATGDFFGCYTAVIVMAVILAVYKIKLSDDPGEWFSLDPRHDMRTSISELARVPRASELRLPFPDNWVHWENFPEWCRYLWFTVFKP